MKAAPFEYHAPQTMDDALALLAELGDEAKVLAGGQSLVPILALRLSRFEHLVDLNRIPALRYVDVANGVARVGAMTTQAAIASSEEVRGRIRLLADATARIGHFQIRNRGTIGGSRTGSRRPRRRWSWWRRSWPGPAPRSRRISMSGRPATRRRWW